MADAFLSYAREDESQARRLAAALKGRGWSVWWDRQLLTGQHFRSSIEQQLKDARCVVVLWSKASIGSAFVQDEAAEGLHEGKLLPVIIDEGVKPPIGFRGAHAADLSDWDGQTQHEGFERFVASFASLAPAIATMTLSLEREFRGDTLFADESPETGSQRAQRPQRYRVRLQRGKRASLDTETSSVVDHEMLRHVVRRTVGLLGNTTQTQQVVARTMEALGSTIGEDILHDLGHALGELAAITNVNHHLRLQIPPELMEYPWELMHHRSGWLSESFALSRTPLRLDDEGRARTPGPLRVLVVANPNPEQHPCPNAGDEGRAVVATFQRLNAEIEGLLDFDVRRDAIIDQPLTHAQLRERFRHGHYDIVHFAGQAMVRPEVSGFVLSDGPLWAMEIRHTWRWAPDQPWLVYASITDASQEEDPNTLNTHAFGLANELVEAGATTCVVPLWRIDDSVIPELVSSFYHQLLRERQTVGEALRRAKAQIKQQFYDPVCQPDASAEATRKEISSTQLLSWLSPVLYGDHVSDLRQRLALPAPEPTDAADDT